MKERTIDFYCKHCKKSFKISHLVTENDSTPVLPNSMMKCHHCNRVVMLKKYTEGQLKEQIQQGKYYI